MKLIVLCQIKLESFINKNKSVEITKIEGFCDKIDSDLYNNKLALLRARTITDYLKTKNVSFVSNYEITSFGENFDQSINQSKNRKAIIYFTNNDLKTKMNTAKKGEFVKLKNINFLNGTNQLLQKSRPILFELLKILQEKKTLKIEIQGHICCQLPSFIDVISESRARAVYDFLVFNKIEKTRLKYRGLGVSKPIYKIPENGEYEQEQNRRVEILILDN